MSAPEAVFSEPWEAQVFALATTLQDRGVFTGAEWADMLGAEVSRDPCRSYYEAWLAALEHIVIAKGASDASTLAAMKAAWERCAQHAAWAADRFARS